MPTRRGMLSSLGTLGAAVTSPGWLFSAESSLPESIAALKNRRNEATPIAVAEREQRLERARALMRQHRIAAITLTGGTSLEYFTGVRAGNSERLFAFVLPQKGVPFYICPAFEEDRMREGMNQIPLGRESKMLFWEEDQNPYALLAATLREVGGVSGKLGLEERVPFLFADGIGQASQGAKGASSGFEITSATAITAGCRSIKSPAELKLMQLANEVTLSVYEAAWKALKPGMTNADFSDLISAGYRQTGFQGHASCQVNAYSALPHGSRQPQVIKDGSLILIDDGCTVEGYQSDISRTFVAGKATDKMKRVFDIVHRAQTAALNAARPGVPCETIDAAARKVVEDAGFGPGYKYFTHRLGHGIGMDGHEWPYLVKGNRQPLAPGVTTSDEPGIYIQGEFGVRLEDDLYVTPDGAKLFTPQSQSIEHPFA